MKTKAVSILIFWHLIASRTYAAENSQNVGDDISKALLFAVLFVAAIFGILFVAARLPKLSAKKAPPPEGQSPSLPPPIPAARKFSWQPFVYPLKMIVRVAVGVLLLFMLANAFTGKPLTGTPKISSHRANWRCTWTPEDPAKKKATFKAQMLRNENGGMDFILFAQSNGKEEKFFFMKADRASKGIWWSEASGMYKWEWDLTPGFTNLDKTYTGWVKNHEGKTFFMKLEK